MKSSTLRGIQRFFQAGPGQFIPFILACVTISQLMILACPPEAQGQKSAADVLIAEAILALDEKRYQEALEVVRKAEEIFPNHPETLYYKGLILMAQGNLDEAIVVLGQASKLAPDNISITFQQGVAYFSKGEYDQAEPLLTRVFIELPFTPNVGYYVGFMRYRTQDYQGALEAFKSGISKDEQILQLTHFYSGLALAILGLPQQAVTELGEASRVRTVSPLTGPADRLRDTLVASRETKDRFHGQIRVGGFIDTNVAVVPQSTGEPIIETLRSRDSNAIGALTSARFDVSLFGPGPVEGNLSYSLFQTFNIGNSAFNVTNHLGALGIFYKGLLGSMPFQRGIQFSFDNTTLGGDQFLQRYSIVLLGTLVESQRHLTTVQGRLQIKEFEGADISQIVDPTVRAALTADNRSGANWMAGVTHIIRFEGARHLIRGGVQIDTDATLGNNFDYTGFRFQAGGVYTLLWEAVRLRYDYDLYFRNYDNANTRFSRTGLLATGMAPNVIQTVTEQNHVFRVEKPFPHNITAAIDLQLTFSRSNIDILFNFDRQVVTGSVTWAF